MRKPGRRVSERSEDNPFDVTDSLRDRGPSTGFAGPPPLEIEGRMIRRLPLNLHECSQ